MGSVFLFPYPTDCSGEHTSSEFKIAKDGAVRVGLFEEVMLLACLSTHYYYYFFCQAHEGGGEKYSLRAVEIVAHDNQNVISY